MIRHIQPLAAIGAVGAITLSANASIVEYVDYDLWSSAVGTFATIDFTDIEDGVLVNDQYAAFGADFGNTAIAWYNPTAFDEDGYGVLSIGTAYIVVELDVPRFDIALHTVSGGVGLLVYSGDVLLGIAISSHSTSFVGVQSSVAFDRIAVAGPLGPTAIDNLYIGEPIPGPGAPVLLGLVVALGRRRRRNG